MYYMFGIAYNISYSIKKSTRCKTFLSGYIHFFLPNIFLIVYLSLDILDFPRMGMLNCIGSRNVQRCVEMQLWAVIYLKNMRVLNLNLQCWSCMMRILFKECMIKYGLPVIIGEIILGTGGFQLLLIMGPYGSSCSSS